MFDIPLLIVEHLQTAKFVHNASTIEAVYYEITP